jgi:GTP-binding protein EngB required for normal cell division
VLAGVLLLIDSRHPGLDADRHAHAWLIRAGSRPHIIGTKVDKLSRAERTRNLKALQAAFGTAALPVSAQTGEGLDDLWKLIAGHRRTATDGRRITPESEQPGNTDKTEEKR